MAAQNILLFRKWQLSEIEIKDIGLKTSICLKKTVMPMDFGRSALKRFNKADVNIAERLVNKLMHFGKKNAKNTGRMGGKKYKATKIVKTVFEIINLKLSVNPVECLIKAIEHSAPNEDTTRIAYGGVVYHLSVDIAPLRRVDLSLRFISEGAKEKSFANSTSIEECLAEELILASNNNQNSFAIKKKNEQERIAMSSR